MRRPKNIDADREFLEAVESSELSEKIISNEFTTDPWIIEKKKELYKVRQANLTTGKGTGIPVEKCEDPYRINKALKRVYEQAKKNVRKEDKRELSERFAPLFAEEKLLKDVYEELSQEVEVGQRLSCDEEFEKVKGDYETLAEKISIMIDHMGDEARELLAEAGFGEELGGYAPHLLNWPNYSFPAN